MKIAKYITFSFCLLVIGCNIFGQSNQKTVSEMEQTVKTLKQSAKILEYETLKSTFPVDEWEAEEKKDLLENHAYYSLLGKDFKGSCLLPDGSIFVTILIFKENESAHKQIDEFNKKYLGIVADTAKSDEKVYFIEKYGFYAAIVKDRKVILFEDRSGVQGEVIKSLVKDLR